jgi:hypothetical protein
MKNNLFVRCPVPLKAGTSMITTYTYNAANRLKLARAYPLFPSSSGGAFTSVVNCDCDSPRQIAKIPIARPTTDSPSHVHRLIVAVPQIGAKLSHPLDELRAAKVS